MRVKRLNSDDVKVADTAQVKLKMTGNTAVVQFTAGVNKKCPVQNLSKDTYMLKETGEIKQKNKAENRFQSPKSVRKSINRLMDLIRCNVTETEKCKWVTLTYSDVMTDGKKAFLDAKFILLFEEKAPYIANSQIADIWGNGYTDTRDVFDGDGLALYFKAYLSDFEYEDEAGNVDSIKNVVEKDVNGKTKQFIKGERLRYYPTGMNLYSSSRGMKRPEIK